MATVVRCTKCNGIVDPSKELSRLNKFWHRKCFVCEICHTSFDSFNAMTSDGETLYCPRHFPQNNQELNDSAQSVLNNNGKGPAITTVEVSEDKFRNPLPMDTEPVDKSTSEHDTVNTSLSVQNVEVWEFYFSSPLETAAIRLLSNATIIKVGENGTPTTYKLQHREEIISQHSRLRKCYVGEAVVLNGRYPSEKIIMMVGATGAGKSTMINAIVNYYYGTRWNDDFRLKLITEEDEGINGIAQSQTKSQTKWITAYTLHQQSGCTVPFTLTIIDTPGFGDTEGTIRDEEITKQIREFFQITGPHGIDHIDAIGFVVQSSVNRLTPTQKYIFDSILSIFGKDIGTNIFLIITFADGQSPPVLEAVNTAHVPYRTHSKFNNSALFAKNKLTVQEENENFDQMFWKLGTTSLQYFFTEFQKVQSVSLILTKEVLLERQHLEAIVQGIQPQIQLGLNKLEELRQEIQVIKAHENDILQNKKFEYKIKMTKQRKIDLPKNIYVTNCLKCNYTCHYPCRIPDDKDKYNCAAMINKGPGASCNVCPGKCIWNSHCNNPYRFELYQEDEMRTSEEMKQRYERARDDGETALFIGELLINDFEQTQKIVYGMIGNARRAIERLEQIALKQNPLSIVDYITLMITSEQQEGKPGWQERIHHLNEAKQKAELMQRMKDPNYDVFEDCDIILNEFTNSAGTIQQSASKEPCGKSEDIIKFRLNEDDQAAINAQTSTNSTSQTKFENVDENQSIIILSIDVELSDKNIFSAYNIKSFDNPFQFIAKTLSVKDKTIYLIISTSKSHSIIPIIHKHYCIEKIYLHGSTDSESSPNWSSMSEKISGCYSNINELYKQIVNDIKITVARPLRWNRAFDFFTMLHTQQSENRYSVIKISTEVPRDEYIVIFHCDGRKLFHTDKRLIPISEVTNAEECLQLIHEQTQSQIFLVISGGMLPLEMRSIFALQQIHAIYFFHNNELEYPMNKRKVSGLFNKLEDLSEQLYKDILFYREQHIHTSRIDICPKFDQRKIRTKELNDKQIVFLKSQLFSDILPQTPLLEFKLEDLTEICTTLLSNKGKEIARYLKQLHEDDGEVQNFVQDPKFSQIVLRLHHSDKLNELFILQKPFIDIQKRVFQSIEISTTDIVYLTKIISNDTLKILESSSDKFISIGTFILATRSLIKARNIARQMANNGLMSVLFEIEVVRGTHLLNLDNDRVLFRVSAVFCLKSINQAPDGTWYVKIKCVDKEFHRIKEQLEFAINVKLSWLTYGNYLYFLNCFEEGEAYFKYVLDRLSSKHIYQSAIYNNMGLLYAKKYEETEDHKEHYLNMAKTAYSKVLENVELIESSPTIKRNEDQPCIELSTTDVIPINATVDYATVVGNIADFYYKAHNYEEAMKSYMEALELSVDQQSSLYYQKMILAIKEHLKK